MNLLGILRNRKPAPTKQKNPLSKTQKQRVGKEAEHQAEQFLLSHGLKLRQRNYLCKLGEIDLIMQQRIRKEWYWVFVEVRYRRSQDYGGAGASITPAKQKRIVRAAQHYLLSNSVQEQACRIDVVLVTGTERDAKIEWIPNAIEAAPN